MLGSKRTAPPTYEELAPRCVDILSSLSVVQLSCGTAHSACVTHDGKVLTWGEGKDMRLGYESAQEEGPRMVEGLEGENITSVTCGERFTAALTDTGRVFTWGHAGGGLLGGANALGREVSSASDGAMPGVISVLEDEGVEIIEISAGKTHMIALDSDGMVWSWGKGEYGRLGNGGSNDQLLPTPVELLRKSHAKPLPLESTSVVQLQTTDRFSCGEGTIDASWALVEGCRWKFTPWKTIRHA